MGVSDKITSIAIPLGATVNMDAVSIVLSFMIVFFANACGVEVSTSMMIVILLANVILSVGTPRHPRWCNRFVRRAGYHGGSPGWRDGRLYQHQYSMRYGRYLRERYWRYGRLRGAEREN